MKPLFVLLLCTLPLAAAKPAPLPEAGPENSGLRLRLLVDSRPDNKEGYQVQLDLLNTSEKPVTLTGNWIGDRKGDLRAYVAAAISIETTPAIKPWIGGVAAPRRTIPQPTETIKPGKSLTLTWKTEERKLKNEVSNPNEAQNPIFPFPGLYSVHANLTIQTAQGMTSLRSNEQLVTVGGSKAQPKSTHGELWHAYDEGQTGAFSLGSLQQAEVGDVFEYHSKRGSWRLTLTDVDSRRSLGKLERLHERRADSLQRGMKFTLVQKK